MSATIDWNTTGAHKLKAYINGIRPFLHLTGTWQRHDVDMDQDRALKYIRRLRDQGSIEIVGTDWYGNHRVQQYRWKRSHKEPLKEYAEQVDTLPKCGCRVHIPDTSDDPAGIWCCDHCGQWYSEAFFREIAERDL